MAVPLPLSRQHNIEFMNTISGRAFGLPPPYTRKIDLVDGKREIPMKILCLGYSRTGTLSLYIALQMLGYKPYHMAEAVKNANVDMPCWIEGIEAKFCGKGKLWGEEEFDKLIGGHDAVLDVPCILFVEELLAAYPSAKVILTERPVEVWLKSMQNSIGEVFSWRRWRYVAWANTELAAPLWELIGVKLTNLKWGGGDYSENSVAAKEYLEHNQLVRKVCPPERLFEFKSGSGWEPLCQFLGTEAPDVPYPNFNDKEMFIGSYKAILDRATYYAVQKVLKWTVPVGLAAVGAAWYWQTLRS